MQGHLEPRVESAPSFHVGQGGVTKENPGFSRTWGWNMRVQRAARQRPCPPSPESSVPALLRVTAGLPSEQPAAAVRACGRRPIDGASGGLNRQSFPRGLRSSSQVLRLRREIVITGIPPNCNQNPQRLSERNNLEKPCPNPFWSKANPSSSEPKREGGGGPALELQGWGARL